MGHGAVHTVEAQALLEVLIGDLMNCLLPGCEVYAALTKFFEESWWQRLPKHS